MPLRADHGSVECALKRIAFDTAESGASSIDIARDFVAWLSGTKPNSVLSSERLTVVDIVAVGASRRLSMDE